MSSDQVILEPPAPFDTEEMAEATMLDAAESEAAVDQTPPVATASLRQLFLSGSAWTFVGYGFGQALRFGSNLILTRLLVPEIFGVMMLAQVFVQGLQMFADIGILPSVVQDKRGDDQRFLNTAFTIQVFRGFALGAAACLIAWPAATFYGEPVLLAIIPLISLSAVMHGFSSTSLCTLQRHLAVKTLTKFEVTTQALSIIATVLLALLMRNIWALAIGGLIGPFSRLIVSHTILQRGLERNRFQWDREAAARLFRFGRWIFLGTAITFLASQGDKLVLGKVFTTQVLGLYAIGYFLADALPQFLRAMSHKVVFPVYARLADRKPETLRWQIRRIRTAILALSIPGFALLIVAGDLIVWFFYPAKYFGAGWMLQVLALRGVFFAINNTVSPVLLAVGDSFRHLIMLIASLVTFTSAMIAGYFIAQSLGYDGAVGVVWGVALAPALGYPMLAWAVHQHGAWMPRMDARAIVATLLLVTAGLYLRDLIGI